MRLFYFLPAVLLVAGCAHSLQFLVVDSSSGHPLNGVESTLTRVDYHFLMRREAHEAKIEATGTNGLVVVDGVRNGTDFVTFRKPDYRDATAGLNGKGKIGIFSPDPPTDPDPDYRYLHQIVTNSTGVIVIPLVTK